WRGAAIPPEYGGIAEQLLTLDDLLGILRGAGRDLDLAIELKHPSPFGQQLEDELLENLMAEGWDPETSRVGNVTVTFMSFHPDAVRHLNDHVPAEYLCQLLDDVQAEDLKDSVFLGPLALGAVATLVRRAMHEGELLVAERRVGIAGPGVAYVRPHEGRVRRWLQDGMRLRVWTVDSPADVELCRELGVQEITTNRPAGVRRQLERAPAAGL
ncbi:glycerophosphodiester phosphodiesterase, partial [Arthrobacter deserti]|nr:glycerophosphodiester phosphodiesterase [Arthrobacter deserti]